MTNTITRKGVKLTKRQAEVYDVFTEFGVALPDHALVPLAQHASRVHQSSSGIRTRRAELVRKGLVRLTSTTKTGSGRTAGVYKAV
jgi:predicted ArsR family transcriptional regulator